MIQVDDKAHNFFDIVFKLISGLFILIGFIVSIKQFNINSEMEFRKIYFGSQIEYMNQLIDVTSKLSALSTSRSTDKEKLVTEFKSLNSGKVSYYIENESLQKEIEEFNEILFRIQDNRMEYKGNNTFTMAKESARRIGQEAKKHVDKIYETQYEKSSIVHGLFTWL